MAGYSIVTRYAGPTNYRGARVIATGPAPAMDARPTRAIVAWDYAADPAGNHAAAAAAAVRKLRAAGWRVRLGGTAVLPDDSGRVHLLEYVR